MPGNSSRRNARSTPKKGASRGSGGQRRRSLEGRGPTPKAEERTAHPARRRAGTATRAEGQRPSTGGARGGRPPGRRGVREGAETVAGRNPVVEALRAQVPATTLYVAERVEADDRVRESLRLATNRRIPLLEVPRAELDRITDGAVHQGLALQVPPYAYADPSELLQQALDGPGTPLVVALDGVTDPRNLGAVVRSTAAFGGSGVVVPERRAAGMSAGAWKASAGAAARIPVARATNLTRFIEDAQKAGFFVAGLAADGEVALPDLEAATDPLLLVVGSEGAGLSRLVARTCDLLVSIPMAAGTESLNAGVAAGVALYEIARRRA